MSKKVRNTLIIVNALILLYFGCLLVETIQDNIKVNNIQNQKIITTMITNEIHESVIVYLINGQSKIKYKNKEQTRKIISLLIKQALLINKQAEIKQNNKEQDLKIISLKQKDIAQALKIVSLKEKNIEQDLETMLLKAKDTEQDKETILLLTKYTK